MIEEEQELLMLGQREQLWEQVLQRRMRQTEQQMQQTGQQMPQTGQGRGPRMQVEKMPWVPRRQVKRKLRRQWGRLRKKRPVRQLPQER